MRARVPLPMPTSVDSRRGTSRLSRINQGDRLLFRRGIEIHPGDRVISIALARASQKFSRSANCRIRGSAAVVIRMKLPADWLAFGNPKFARFKTLNVSNRN